MKIDHTMFASNKCNICYGRGLMHYSIPHDIDPVTGKLRITTYHCNCVRKKLEKLKSSA